MSSDQCFDSELVPLAGEWSDQSSRQSKRQHKLEVKEHRESGAHRQTARRHFFGWGRRCPVTSCRSRSRCFLAALEPPEASTTLRRLRSIADPTERAYAGARLHYTVGVCLARMGDALAAANNSFQPWSLP